MPAVHDMGAEPLEFELISDFFYHGMNWPVTAEASVLHDEEGITFVDRL